jgi:hypothetical protein
MASEIIFLNQSFKKIKPVNSVSFYVLAYSLSAED